jgi:hypothetical protein
MKKLVCLVTLSLTFSSSYAKSDCLARYDAVDREADIWMRQSFELRNQIDSVITEILAGNTPNLKESQHIYDGIDNMIENGEKVIDNIDSTKQDNCGGPKTHALAESIGRLRMSSDIVKKIIYSPILPPSQPSSSQSSTQSKISSQSIPKLTFNDIHNSGLPCHKFTITSVTKRAEDNAPRNHVSCGQSDAWFTYINGKWERD